MANIINQFGQVKVGIQPTPPPPPKLLDVYTNAAGAYSLRKLRTAYTGNAITVRRSSDNQSQDIGFDANGNLDTTTLLSFVGSGNGYVSKWYDQSGNGKYLYNNTAANQPIIVLSGVLQMNGNKPSIYWDNTQQHLFYVYSTEWSGINNIRSVFINMKWLTGSGRNPILGESSDAMYHADTTAANLILSEAYANYNIKYGALYLNNVSKNVNNFYRNPNNNQIISMVHLAQIGYFNRLSIDRGNSTTYFKGYYTEIIIYTSNQTNNVSGINDNMNTYYSVY